MTNLEKLEKEIRLKLPRLMELSDGCIIKHKVHAKYKIELVTKHIIYFVNKDCIDDVFIQYINKDGKSYEIIGHEIKLNDVLEWYLIYLNTSIEKYLKERKVGNVYAEKYRLEKIRLEKIGELISSWDLSKNLLKDQNKQLIYVLCKLISQ